MGAQEPARISTIFHVYRGVAEETMTDSIRKYARSVLPVGLVSAAERTSYKGLRISINRILLTIGKL